MQSFGDFSVRTAHKTSNVMLKDTFQVSLWQLELKNTLSFSVTLFQFSYFPYGGQID